MDLLSYSYEELEQLLITLCEPKYRASQIFPQLHRGIKPSEMTNISKATAEKLEASAVCFFPQIKKKLVSAVDGTVKYLFELIDGNCIETVVMKYKHGNTVCVSSQVGCRMGCAFCASTIGGKIRDLTAGEILGQIISAQKDVGERIDNIVMMGIGEPMDNYDNVLKFLKNVNDSRGICIGYRHISISTCGHVEGILKLAKEKLPVTLSLSLHAHDDITRNKIMPVNKRWPIHEVMSAIAAYRDACERRISFEYTLIDGQNCTVNDASALAYLLNRTLRTRDRTFPIHVNLIPVNEVKETGLKPPPKAEIQKFCDELEKRGIRATVRRTLGPDINASCGQLRRNTVNAEKTEENKQ